MRSLLLSAAAMVAVAMGLGFYNAMQPGAPPEKALIILEADGTARTSDSSILDIRVPPQMRITREFSIRSAWPVPLTEIKLLTSCGCTTAEIDKAVLRPEEIGTLRCVFDGGDSGHSRRVNVRVLSPDSPGAVFSVEMNLRTDPELRDEQLKSVPSEIVLDRVWKRGMIEERRFLIHCGGNVARDGLYATSSSDRIEARVTALSEGSESGVAVVLRDLPAGLIAESIFVSFHRGIDVYTLKIPVSGIIKPGFDASPRSVSFGESSSESAMTASVILTAVDAHQGTPVVSVDGDCELIAMEQTGDQRWQVSIALRRNDPKKTYYGTIRVRGDWHGAPVLIPVSAALR